MKLIEAKNYTALLGSIGRTRAKFNTMVQEACYTAIGYSVRDRNITPAKDLLDVIGSHLKHVVVAHLEKHGNIKFDKGAKGLVFHENINAKEGWTEGYSAYVAAQVWEKAKPEPTVKSMYDVEEELGKFLERMTNAAKKGVQLKNRDLLDSVTQAYNRHVTASFLATATADEDGTCENSGADPREVARARDTEIAKRLAEKFKVTA